MWGAARLVLRALRNTSRRGPLKRIISVKEWFFVSRSLRYCDLGAGVAAARSFCSALNAVACNMAVPKIVPTVARYGNRVRVPEIGASQTRIGSFPRAYLSGILEVRWPAIGRYFAVQSTAGPA